MSTVLVTGGSGLIGRQLLADLAPRVKVVATGRHAPSVSGVNWIGHDLASPNLPDMPRDTESVVYLAQSEHFREFPERADDVFAINVAGVMRLLDWSRQNGVRRFVYASSGGIYGHGGRAFSEQDEVAAGGPLGFYLSSKHCGELLVESYASLFTVVILRFFFVYGPGQRQSMLIPRLVDSVRNGGPIVLYGDEGIRINPIHVSDAAAAIAQSLTLHASHKINIAGPKVYTLKRLSEIIGESVGRRAIFKTEEAGPSRDLVADIKKMKTLLGAPSVDFETGVRSMLDSEKS